MLGTITLTVGQTDAMPQIEEVPEMTEVQDEVCPKVNGEKEEDEAADKTSATEEKVSEEKPDEANEVGFKKIFRFVGFKFTLKKDKNEKVEPVQLLTVKETEDGAVEKPVEKTEDEAEVKKAESGDESKTDDAETVNGGTTEASEDVPADGEAETVTGGAEEDAVEEQPVEEVVTSTEKEKEAALQTESDTATAGQEVQSPLKRFFTQGIFSNLRKKTSFKKSKEEEPVKEKPAEEDIKEAEEKVGEVADDGDQAPEAVEEEKAEEAKMPEEPEKAEASPDEVSPVAKEQEEKLELETKEEHEIAPEQTSEPTTSEAPEEPTAESTDDAKPTEDKPVDSAEDQPEKSPTEEQPEKPSADTTEAEVLPSQEKAKAQVSPLKKLFTGAGLKKLSSKKQKGKKETDSKLVESGEQAGEQIQSPTEQTEVPKPSSEASSPEESGEHVVAEESQAEVGAEAEDEAATSDSEKKKDGILPWASFKKLVTPKKRVKRSSDSEEDAPADKPKSATLSSTESAGLEEKTDEVKPSETVTEEAKEESQAESKTETKADKLEQSTEEPKRKMDTSVSWEALICVGSAKKRARKTSDSDEEEAKIEEEVKPSEEDQAKTAESPLISSVEADHENLASSPEPEGELVSTWESFKRLVTQRKKPKTEDKSDDSSAPEQATSDSEIPKEESSFSLRKLIPRRKKKSEGKQQTSSDVGSAEEDSDTPAVVPLSEYDTEQSEKVSPEESETENLKAEITALTPGKISAEDRSPSWISATVEGTEDDPDAKLLSDIPEEGDAATPKSADNTIVDEIVEFTSEAVTAHEPVEETEMVSALSRITGSPVTSGETSPVPGDGVLTNAEVILQDVVETITVTSTTMAVTVTEEQTSCIVSSNIPLQVEAAAQEKEVELDVLEKIEATTVCEMDRTVEVSLEALSAVSEAVSVEVAPEDQAAKPEEAKVAELVTCEVEVPEVQAVCKEEAVKEMETIEAVTESVAQTVSEVQEVVVAAVQQEAEIIADVVEAKNTPKMEAESPIEPTIEVPVCEQTAHVTEVAVAEAEEVQKLENVEESIAVVAEEPVVEVEVTTTLRDDSISVPTVSQEAPVPVASALPEEVCVSPSLESKTEELNAAASVEDSVKCASSSITAVEGFSEAVQDDVELSQAALVIETEAIQVQSTVIVQEVIQNVVENLEMLESRTTVTEETPSEIRDGEKAADDAPAEVEKPSTDIQALEEQYPGTEETENKVEQEQMQIITEISPEPAIEAVQISETIVASTTDEIEAEQEEVASISVDDIQESTAVEKQEVELQTCEVNEEKEVGSERGDGTSEVEATTGHEEATTETPVQSESDIMATVSTMQTQMLEVVSQQVQGIQIETTTDIDVGIIHVVDADKEEKNNTKEDAGQSQDEDTTQRVLEEAQKDVSAKDIKGDEGSVDAICQETAASAEDTTNAVQEEKEVGSTATETASMS